MSNVDTVQAIYAAFRVGDVPAILSRLAEDVDWDYGIGPIDVPWLQRRRGRDEVAGFFAALQAVEIRQFTPKVFLDGGQVVVVLLDIKMVVLATDVVLEEEDEVHVWHFDDDGAISRMTHKLDTLAAHRALHPDDRGPDGA